MEIILSFIEFNQFLKFVVNKLNNTENSKHLSTINENENNDNNNENENEITHNRSISATRNSVLEDLREKPFDSHMDKILFNESHSNVKKIKTYTLAKSVPISLIIDNNVKNVSRFRKQNKLSLSEQRKAKYLRNRVNRPLLALKKTTEGKEKEKEQEEKNIAPEDDHIANEINSLLLQLCTFYTISFELYHKYVKVGSEFEINIEYNLKQRFAQLFEDYNFVQLLNNNPNFIDEVNDDDRETITNYFTFINQIDSAIDKIKNKMEIESGIGIMDYIDVNDNYDFHGDSNFNFLVNPQLFDLENYDDEYMEDDVDDEFNGLSMNVNMDDINNNTDGNVTDIDTDDPIGDRNVNVNINSNTNTNKNNMNNNNSNTNKNVRFAAPSAARVPSVEPPSPMTDTMDVSVNLDDHRQMQLNQMTNGGDDDNDDDGATAGGGGDGDHDADSGDAFSLADIQQATTASMIYQLSLNDLSWLLLKKPLLNVDENNNDDNQEIKEQKKEILKELESNVFGFLLFLCKLYSKTNEELVSLLSFSFHRLKKTEQYRRLSSKQ